MSTLNSIGRVVLATTLAAAVALPAVAQTYPSKPVRLIVGVPAGGAVDTIARLVSARFQEVFGQPFVVENRAGANGNIAADVLAKSAPDGYTIMLVDLGTFTSGPAVYPSLPFDPATDFTPITNVVNSPYGVAVTPSLPVSSLPELVAYAKANPGKFNYAMLGNGSASHLAGIDLFARAKVPVTFVPYKGGAPALADVSSGQAQALGIAMLSTYPFVRGGKLKLLAVMGGERLSFLPEVPTVAERGYPGFLAGQYQALYGPKGLPRDVAERLRAEAVKFFSQPEMKKRLADQGAEVTLMGPDELTKFVADERAKYVKLAREHNVKID